MKINIGTNVKQKDGFSAFIPAPFSSAVGLELPQSVLLKSAEAERLVGKLDGVTHTLPDVDFFLYMFVTKDAASSAQIEGTKATMVDAIEMNAGIATKETDADDILYYVKALHYGTDRLNSFPLSLRLIREIHSELMTGARSTHFADPGQFRRSQNWIGGTSPSNALYIPPPVNEMNIALNDFETFFREENNTLPLIHIALVHSHFETIHPFLDGNGRTGRLLITMLLCHRKLLERPVLFLSSFFKKNQKVYYEKLHGYHEGNVMEWFDFFLEGVIETANDSIRTSKEITHLRDDDMAKLLSLARRESESGVLVLRKLYAQPIITTRIIMDWTKFTRAGAQKLIDRFISLGILEPWREEEAYDRKYIYKKYLDIFTK
jgi:Fic family protein